MILMTDGEPREAFALVHGNGTILLSDVCTSSFSAMELHKQQVLLQPQRGPLRVTRVLITVTVDP